MNRPLFFLIATLCSSWLTASPESPRPDRLVDSDRVDRALANLVAEHGLVGVSGLIYERGEEVYFGAHGYAMREEQRPMRRDTLAYIYSMTKPITGVALMTLYEEGAFRLDDPLAKYAPEFADLQVYAGLDDHGDPILEAPHRAPTIRDVTRHTAGFSRGSGHGENIPLIAEAYQKADPKNDHHTLTEMAERLGRIPLSFHPGTRWLYGDSVDIQAFLVERISGQPFADYVREKIFQPLGMRETAYFIDPEHDHRRTRIYERQDDGSFAPEDAAEAAYHLAPRAFTPGGSRLISTLDDYMRFARMLLNEGELEGHRILQSSTVRLMASNALPATLTDSIWLPSKGQMGFGIDFAVRIASPATPDENSGEIGEFFWDGRASTLFWVDPVNDIAAVLFAQFLPFNTVPAHKNFRDAIYWDDLTAAAPRE
ncbi:MAG: beta-lactamase family protein [Opitutaceae bacterium]|jgi:CubicO group peptidase (beta-lactamase class C family)|nr:beta-lactamase family protein [Opitutaceae bacterium]